MFTVVVRCYHTIMSTLFRIRHTLNDQRTLCNIGPMIPASWGVTPKDGPTPNTIVSARNIHGNMLFDTGAGGIAIDESVAQRLGLQPLSKKENLHGLGGKLSVSMYNATLFLPVEMVRPVGATPTGSTAMIGFPLTVHGVADIQANHEAHNLRAANGLPVIGILGRLFLQFTKFVYDGVLGNLVIEIDESVQYPRKG
jgi:predicted aspartyl protease